MFDVAEFRVGWAPDQRRTQLLRCPETGSSMTLPPADALVLPGVHWGRLDCLFTPAYWAAQAWHHHDELEAAPIRFSESLIEEVAACLLGGHGVPAEVGIAAFQAIKSADVLAKHDAGSSEFEAILSAPLDVGGRRMRYRFARQRARYLASAVSTLHAAELSDGDDREFRDQLLMIHGIGLKTASWITRNWLDSDEVAVLDVHVIRAGQLMGLFPRNARLDREYRMLEQRFLAFSRSICVRASRLDALIWRQMRFAGEIARRIPAC